MLGHNRMHHPYTVSQGYDSFGTRSPRRNSLRWDRWRRGIHKIEWSWAGAGPYYLHQVWWKKMMVGPDPARWARTIRRERWVVTGLHRWDAGSFQRRRHRRRQLGRRRSCARHPHRRCCRSSGFSLRDRVPSCTHTSYFASRSVGGRSPNETNARPKCKAPLCFAHPKGLNFFIHWIMIPVPHSVDFRVPMYHLEEAAAAIEAGFPGSVIDKPLRFRDFVANTRACKLYDFDAGHWLTYAEGRKQVNSV